MTDYHKFDDIRPYTDQEIPAAMERIAANPQFPVVAKFVFPDMSVQEAQKLVRSFSNIHDFQYGAMKPLNRAVLEGTVTEFKLSGAEKLDRNKRYLFVSNHRDIVLDSCILMYALDMEGHETGEITFGANLMQGQMVIDIGKSNKMFRVERGGTPREMYASSLHLSEYIRFAITEKHQSAWIAQRNGRTKDGVDRTDVGVIKMFSMSGPKERVENLAELNIVPVSVSYEWEPCDILKARELYATRDGQPYVKKPGEDLNSILSGIVENKGRVHFQICDPLTRQDLESMSDQAGAQFYRSVAGLMDQRICSGYHLFPNSFIAHDIRSGSNAYSDRYSQQEYYAFAARLGNVEKLGCGKELRDIFLGIYANPVDNVNN